MGHVRHAGVGETVIGAMEPDNRDRLARLQEFLQSAGIAVQITGDVTGVLWSKLLVNVGINALTGITGLPNGGLLDYPETRHLMREALREAHLVAQKKGITLAYADPEQKVTSVCTATAQNISSMLQDLRNRKRTEIDYINGAVVAEGIRCGLSLPVNQALTNVIHAIEIL
jgi:2-dehydropantoate 2-reductase